MKIEDEIQVKKFFNEYHKATLNIVFTNNWLTEILERRAGKENITLQQFNVLRILRGQYPNAATNNLIKERMIDKMSDVSRIIDRLVGKGLVSRSKCDADKRAVDLKITDTGLSVLENLEQEMLAMDVLSKNLTEAECATLNDLLDKFRG